MTGRVDLTGQDAIPQGATYNREFRWTEPSFLFEALNAGTSAGTEPVWPIEDCDTILDNDILWVNRGGYNPSDPGQKQADCWFASHVYREGAIVHSLVVPVDLTGYTAKMEIRVDRDDIGTPLLSLTDVISVDGIILLGTTDGLFTIVIEAATTAAFTFTKAVYDVLLTSPVMAPTYPNGISTRVIQGDVAVSKDTTL